MAARYAPLDCGNLLRSALFAIMLMGPAAPSHAQPVTLVCRTEAGPSTWTLRITYATGLVEQIGPGGNPYPNRTANATVSPNAIVWSTEFMDSGTVPPTKSRWIGNIDRLSGTGSIQFYRVDFYHYDPENVSCRQATAPKF
jgi:hypothetical protein